MMKARYLGLVAAAGLLVGCVGADVDQLRDADLSLGALRKASDAIEFNTDGMDLNTVVDRLMHIVRDRVNSSQVSDPTQAADASAAANGEAVGPTDLSDWNLPAEHEDELRTARASLLEQLDGGARDSLPMEAAMAQARFDCWVEQVEENFQPDDIATCRDEFYALLEQLSPAAAAADVYIVFFDWDQSVITDAAMEILSDVAADYAAGSYSGVDVVGHADRSGPDAYNLGLSMRRAEAVRSSLGGMGVPDGVVSTDGLGESQPLVETPDGVREPSNRRAEIRFQ